MKTKLLLLTVFLSCSIWAQTEQIGNESAVKDSAKITKKEVKTKGEQKTETNAEKDCNECGNYDLVYDFKCKKFKYNGKDVANLQEIKINYKKGFRFKIININKYLYETTISFEDVVLASEEPELFKKLFLGNGFNLDGIDFLEEKANGFVDPDTPTKKDDFIKALKDFKDKYNNLLQNYLDAYALCLSDVPCCKDKKTDKNEFRSLSNSLFNLRLSFNEIESLVAAELEATEAKLKESKETLKSNQIKLSKATTEPEKLIIKADITANELAIEALEKELIKLKASKKEVDKFKETLDSITDDKLMEIIHFERNLINDNFEFIAPTIYPTGDKLLLNLKIAPNTSSEAKKWQVMPLSNDEFNLDLRVRNKWFYSFSTGPFVGLSDSYRTDKYGWQKQSNGGIIDANSQYKLVKSGREGMPVGIAAFANFGTKLCDFYGIGFSVGAGATILNDPQIAYFAGVTQFFGQEKQFNLTAGLSFMQVKELNKDLYTDIGTQLYDSPIDLDYTKKFISGFFVSLSYSVFTPTNSKKATAGNAPNKPTPAATTTTPPKAKEANDSKTVGTPSVPFNDKVKKVKIKY